VRCRSFPAHRKPPRSATPTTTLLRPDPATRPCPFDAVELALRVRGDGRLVLRKFDLAAAAHREREPLHAALTSQLRLRANLDPRTRSARERIRKRKARVNDAARVREHVLEATQVAEFVDTFQRRGIRGQLYAIDEVWRAGCHGPRIIGPVPTPVKMNPVQVVVFEVPI